MKKNNAKRKERKSRSNKSIAYKIIRSFVLRNIYTFVIFLIVYILVYLFASLSQDYFNLINNLYFGVLAPILSVIFETETIEFMFYHHYIPFLILYFWAFIINCFITSVSTLVNFNKTYKSLEAFTDSKKDIAFFSKEFSDIEIKLKDIKLEVLDSRNQAVEAENRKNDLVMYLAHDLKTPLTSVIGYLTLLQECPELPTEQKAKFTDIALDKAYRLEQLITEFFEITRFNINSITLQKNRIDLNMMINQIVDEFYPMLSEKNIDVSIDIPDKILMFADSDKIARVFDNLLKNAVNYSYENSIIRVGARIKQDRVIIKFRNRCDEIPQDKLQRLFDKFYRGDASRSSQSGGSGLGLAIAKQITELHGGTIKAKSTTDYTDFTVILPYLNAGEITDEQLEF